jgi:tetratricopeptide (TPR) repeat protein
VWGAQYERADTSVFGIQEEIAQEVATAVAGRLLPPERASLAHRPTVSSAAYAALQRGNYYLARRTAQSVTRAIAEYEAAARLDPASPQPLAQAALAYAIFYEWGWLSLPRDSVLTRGLAAADRALRQDSTASDAWAARAMLLAVRAGRTSPEAQRAFDSAVRLDPKNAEAYSEYGSTLRFVGDDSGAVVALQHALALDPQRPVTLLMIADVSYVNRRFAEARGWLDSAIAVDPGFPYAHKMRGLVRLRLGEADAALVDVQTAMGLGDDSGLPIVYASRGDTTAARLAVTRAWQELPDTMRPSVLDAVFLGQSLLAIGDRDGALSLLERVRPRGGMLWFFLRWPELDPLRGDPRFQRLVEETKP